MTCPAETIGRCEGGRLIHECHVTDEHTCHECACGHRWADQDD